MNFIFGFDEGFAMTTSVAIRSLDRFLGPGDQIFLLHDGVSASTLRKVESCVLSATATTVDCASMFEAAWKPPAHVTRAAFLRYLAPAILRNEPRAIYMDGDVVVRRSPSYLSTMDLGDASLAAVRSRVAPFAASPGGILQWRLLGIPSNAPYFNSGVLVLNLDRWRERDVTARITAFLSQQGSNTYIADQEAVNVAVVGEWIELDRGWNYVTHVAESFLQQPELEPSDPHIVHYAGRLKPWVFGRQPLFAEDWHALLAETPWAGFTPSPLTPPRGPKAWAKGTARRVLRGTRNLMHDQ
jgi:lipopolysaccharide biosynthesis glycosyltransferase